MSKQTVIITRDDSVGELFELLKGRHSLLTIARHLIKGVEMGSQLLQGQIVKDRLTGKGPFPVSKKRLGVVSGRLRRALRFTKPRMRGGTLSTSVGTNVKYWARHEFGGQNKKISVPSAKVKASKVKARKMRATKVKAAKIKASKVKAKVVKNLFGKGKAVKVKAHTRKAYTRKAYMRKAFVISAHTRPAHTRKGYSFKDTMPKREPVQAGLRDHADRVYGIAIEKQLIKAMEGRMA